MDIYIYIYELFAVTTPIESYELPMNATDLKKAMDSGRVLPLELMNSLKKSGIPCNINMSYAHMTISLPKQHLTYVHYDIYIYIKLVVISLINISNFIIYFAFIPPATFPSPTINCIYIYFYLSISVHSIPLARMGKTDKLRLHLLEGPQGTSYILEYGNGKRLHLPSQVNKLNQLIAEKTLNSYDVLHLFRKYFLSFFFN